MSAHERPIIDGLARRYRRYSRSAFEFVCREYRALRGRLGGGVVLRDPTAEELCAHLRGAALSEWGPLAAMVLENWGIRRTEDFGELVMALIRAGLLAGPPASRLEEFAGRFDFREAFPAPGGVAVRRLGL
jgi:uncharacterized repeat protein (TIGR04138 family)